MKTGFVKRDGKSYAFVEFASVEEIDEFFDEIEERASPRRPSYEA